MIYPVNEIKQIEAHTEISFVCHPNCAQYGGPEGDAGYANAVQVERGISLEEAFEIAKNNSEINHFVYVKGDGMTLIGGDPENDPLGSGYHIIQSKIAIGSGGFFGKGWLSGTQSQLRFLPEAHTDFIFAIIAEEIGFIGCFFLIALYIIFIYTGLRLATLMPTLFAQLTIAGYTILIGLQTLINLAVATGLARVRRTLLHPHPAAVQLADDAAA